MKVGVVGSGPAGAAAASALVDAGLDVEMLDFGNEIEPGTSALATALRDGTATSTDRESLRSARAATGIAQSLRHWIDVARGRAPLLDLTEKTRLGSLFTFRDTEWGIPASAAGAPLSRSLARGGLSNVWGAACYPLVGDDFHDWPIAEPDLAPHYTAAAKMLSLIEPEDELSDVYPRYGALSRVLPLNASSSLLLDHWRSRHLHIDALGVKFGRARLAVRVGDDDGGAGCQLCGLCMEGCPWDAIYRSDWTTKALERRSTFRYRGGTWVKRFQLERGAVVVEAVDVASGEPRRLEYDALFLAAGTLSSLRIAAESLGCENQPVRIYDNDLYLVPLLRTAKGRTSDEPLKFALNELVLRVEQGGIPLHIQLYCMSGAVVDRFRPILDALPGGLQRRATSLLSRLMLAFIYLPSNQSARIDATVEPGSPGSPVSTVRLEQRRSPDSRRAVRRLCRFMLRHQRSLGLAPIGPSFRCTPAGHSGGHLSGGLPMTRSPGPLQCDVRGQLHGAPNVFIADGSALPSLPAQNSTFTIMANAHRIATLFAGSLAG